MSTVGKKSSDIQFESKKAAEEALSNSSISPETVIMIGKRVTNMVREKMNTYNDVFEVMEAFDNGEIGEYDAVRVKKCNDAYGKKDGTATITTYKHITAKHFINVDEAVLAYENKVIEIHEPIKVIVEKDVEKDGKVVTKPTETSHKEKRLIDATIGRIFFNEGIPQDLDFVDRTDDKTKFNLEFTDKATKKALQRAKSVHKSRPCCPALPPRKPLPQRWKLLLQLKHLLNNNKTPIMHPTKSQGGNALAFLG